MMTKFEKRVLAGLMSVMMCFSVVQMPMCNVRAEDEVQEGKLTSKVCSVSVLDEELPEVVAGVKNQTKITTPGEEIRYVFKPEKTGGYYLYLRRGGHLVWSEKDGEQGSEFGAERSDNGEYYVLEEGKVYYIDVSNYYDTSTGTVMWGIEEGQDVTTGTYTAEIGEAWHPMECYRFVAEKAGSYRIRTNDPSNCLVKTENIQREDMGWVEIYVDLQAGEECHIWISSYNNIDRILINWSIAEEKIPEIRTGECKEVMDSNGHYLTYKFVPEETTKYIFSTSIYAKMHLYDRQWNSIKQYNEGEELTLEGGKIYFLKLQPQLNVDFKWSIEATEISVKENQIYTKEEGKYISYKFIPQESAKYQINSDVSGGISVLDENGNRVGGTWRTKETVTLEKGKTYCIKFEAYERLNWKIAKVETIEIQADKEYVTTWEQAVQYHFVPQQTGYYILFFKEQGYGRIYDSDGYDVEGYQYESKGDSRVFLEAGETYNIDIYTEKEPVDWKIEMVKVSGDYKYKIKDDNTIEIVEYLGEETALVIPDTIDGKTVTKLGERSFALDRKIETVVIPESVTEIQYRAFQSCSNLKKVGFGSESQLKTIEVYAFEYCKNLDDIVIPNGVQKIGVKAFAGSGISEMDIPSSVTEIGRGAFAACQLLERVKIGSGVREVSKFMFSGCSNLTQVDFSNNVILSAQGKNQREIAYAGVTKMEYAEFMRCNSLQNLQLPDSVKTINQTEYAATVLSTEQSDVSGEMLAEGRVIGNHAFYNCVSMKSVTIPANVIEIGEYAFGYIEGNKDDGTYWWDDEMWRDGYAKKMNDFTIYGKSGSAAEQYAIENGFEFIAITVTKGDVNDDGSINSADLRLVLRAVCEKEKLTDAQTLAADVEGDGDGVDVQDLRKVLRFVCGKIDEL